MPELINLGDMSIQITRKDIKNVHLSVHPPDGRVTMAAPLTTRIEVARAYAISKLGWIRNQQKTLAKQARETPREFVERESHYVWGRRYLMRVEYQNTKPRVFLDHKHLRLTVRPKATQEKRAELMHEWHKSLLHAEIPPLIERWEKKLNVNVNRYFLQRMKTKWGSCNQESRNIRLNTELVKKPKELLEYVVAHEMVHLLTRRHDDEFIRLMSHHYPFWREARAELNELPLRAEAWPR